MVTRIASNWVLNWFWGLPLIVLNVLIHVAGLGLINRQVKWTLRSARRPGMLSVASTFAVGEAVFSVTLLHALESAMWAGAYRIVGALRDNQSAMLYSLSAITSYGHENISLMPRWQMMGALEALNGWILFGLTTAFLFTVMQTALRGT
jgi:hypothetical protein